MPQSLVRPENLQGGRFRLDGDEAHHVVRVLRKKPGDEIDLFDGRDRRFRGVLTSVDPAGPFAEGNVIREIRSSSDRYRFRLYQGVPKGSKIDFVIEKAVELGVERIVPFLSERGQVKLDDQAAADKAVRWNRIAEAAAKQCERADVPPVAAPAPLASLTAALREGATLVFSLNVFAAPLRKEIRSDDGGILRPNSDIINVVIGPESGLSAAEESLLSQNGARLVSMGERVLRTETAGLAALAILQHEFNQR